MASNYGGFINIPSFYNMHIYNSFPAALIWILIGKMFADNRIRLSKSILHILLLCSAILLYAEYILIQYLDSSNANDCYFSLLLLCPAMFALLHQTYSKNKEHLVLRKASTIYYCSHITIASIIGKALEFMNIEDFYNIYKFFITIVLCTVCCVVIILLQKMKHCNWLKYAY